MDHSYDSARTEELPEALPANRSGIPPEEEKKAAFAPEARMPFPKEFNRKLLHSVDRRFFIVLFLILLAEPALILYLVLHNPPRTNEQYLAKLQSKYVDLFLQNFVVETPAPDKPKNELLMYAKEYADNLAGEAFGTAPAPTFSAPAPGQGTPETRTGSREARAARRRSTVTTRGRAREARSESVGRVGVLGIITGGGSGLVSAEPVEQILNFSELNAVDLEKKLSEVSILRVPRPGRDYYGPAVGSSLGGSFKGENVMLAQRHVRGERETHAGVSAEDLVGALAAPPEKKVIANRNFEKVAAVPSLLDAQARHTGIGGLRGRPEMAQASRDPKVLKEIVLAHNPAIQDCYRAQLKRNPQLKGKVEVRFKISYQGYVSEVRIVATTMGSMELQGCILTKIARWKDFGRVDASVGDVTLRQTYVFGY